MQCRGNHEVAPLPRHEADRLAALQRYLILDTAPEAEFDDFEFRRDLIHLTQ